MITPLYTLIRKEVVRFSKLWPQTILPPIFSIFVYYILFTFYINYGSNYSEYLSSNLILMQMVLVSFNGASFSFFNLKYERNIRYLLSTPVPLNSIIFGYALSGLIRSLVVGYLSILIFAAVGIMKFSDTFQIIFMTLLPSLIFSFLGVLNGMVAKSYDSISIVQTFFVTPLIYLSGIFYPIDLTNMKLEWLLKLNPFVYIVQSFREGILHLGNGFFNKNTLFFIFLCVLIYCACYLLLRYKRERVGELKV